MRERLVVMLVGITALVIALFGIPRAYATADLVQDNEHQQVQRAATAIAVAVTARQEDRPPVPESFLASLREQDERLVYIAADGTQVVSGRATAAESDYTVTRELRGGGRITLAQPDSVVSGQVANALLPLVVLGLGLVLLAALIGLVVARRLARPFGQLADIATQIGQGRFDLQVPRFSIPEAEDVAEALRRASQQLDQLVRRERNFAIHASHELRTPITALRLSLEDLTLWPQTPAEVSAELATSLAELDRLNTAITTLLERAADAPLGMPLDLDLTDLARSAVDRWREAAAAAGRAIELGHDARVAARLVPGPVHEVVDELIENALAHGSGTITVSASEADSHLRLQVADQGSRTLASGPIHAQSRGTLLGGLPRAAALVESMGGYLSVIEAPVTTLVLALPKAAGPTEQILGRPPA